MEGKIILWMIFIRLMKNVNCEETTWNCQFTEENNRATMDFSTLYNKTNDYYIHYPHTNENVSLRIQLCGPLRNKCNDQEGYSACLQTGNKAIGLGRVPVDSYVDGRIMFNFTGDECGNGHYKLHVMMKCDYAAKIPYLELFPYKEDQCDLFIIWMTILACAKFSSDPVEMGNCTVKSTDGNVYDLSGLRLFSDNYVVTIDKKSSIILNVCHPVVYGYRARCLDDSGTCLRTDSGSITYKNIGSVKSLRLKGEIPVLNYEAGEMCTAGRHTQTTISFICDLEANDTLPELSEVESDCHYKLNWRTAAACNLMVLEEYRRKTAMACRITNPVTLTEYNLNSLKGEDRIVKNKDGLEYKFRICEPLLSTLCKTTVNDTQGGLGVCASSSREIGGLANSNLLWNVTGPYLNYTGGSTCGENKSRATIIAFACGQEGSNETNSIDDSNPCNLRIQYYTPFVCEQKNSLCGSGLDVKDDKSCINQSSSQWLLSTISPTEIGAPNQNYVKNSSVVTIVMILFGVSMILITVYLSNSQRRQDLRSRCCSWYFRNPNVRMQYSRINTNEETDALLDAPDMHCQSDSDDDLLRI